MINIPNGLSESERNLYIAAYNRCVELQEKDFTQSISDTVEQVVSVFSAVEIKEESLRNFLFEEISADIEPVINITSDEMKDSDWWKRLVTVHSQYSAKPKLHFYAILRGCKRQNVVLSHFVCMMLL